MENQSNNGTQSTLDSKDSSVRHVPAQDPASSSHDQQPVAKGGGIASQASETIEQLAAGTGKGLGTVAEGIRAHFPDSNAGGAAFRKLADTLETSGQYLEGNRLEEISDDIRRVIRNNPVPTMFVALGIGFILARATMRSSS